MDDSELAARAQQGDIDAFERLALRYQHTAFRAAYLVTTDAAEAEDVVQEALLKACQAMPSFRPGALFRPWLLRIVTNEALNRRRAAGRRARLTLRVAADLPRSTEPAPEATLLAHERRVLVIQALNELNESDRVVLAYRYFLDLSVAEIADVLACPERTARTRLSRAVDRLRRQLLQSRDPRDVDAFRELLHE